MTMARSFFVGVVLSVGFAIMADWSDAAGVVLLVEVLVGLMAGKQPRGVKTVVETVLAADALSMGIFAIFSSSTLVLMALGSSSLRESL